MRDLEDLSIKNHIKYFGFMVDNMEKDNIKELSNIFLEQLFEEQENA